MNNPVNLVDPDGRWPGVTYFFKQKNLGAGLGYGLYATKQIGYAKDNYGKTYFRISSYACFGNQNLYEGSYNPKFVLGTEAGISLGISQNWKNDSFVQALNDQAQIGTVSIKSVVGISGNENSATLTIGPQAGAALTIMPMTVDFSLSISKEESSNVKKWEVKNAVPIKENGKIVSYIGTVATKKQGEYIFVESGVNIDKDGNTSSNNIWISQEYLRQSKKRKIDL